MNYPAASSGVSKFQRFGESQAQQAAGNMTSRDLKYVALKPTGKLPPTVIPAQAGIQFFRSPAWMPACAGMTNWIALVAA
jgi:hypothetical protein